MSRLPLLALLVSILSQCASQEVPPDALFGPRPENYTAIVEGWLQEFAHASESIRDLYVTKPQKDSYHPRWEPEPFYGWRCFASFKAADHTGAYAWGKRKLYVLIHDDEVVFARDVEKPHRHVWPFGE